MRRETRFPQRAVWCLLSAFLLVTIMMSISAQEATQKKFLKKPLVIEDQGSFFIGGVPKITNFATMPQAFVPPDVLAAKRAAVPLEMVGIDRPFTEHDRVDLDRELALDGAPVRVLTPVETRAEEPV